MTIHYQFLIGITLYSTNKNLEENIKKGEMLTVNINYRQILIFNNFK